MCDTLIVENIKHEAGDQVGRLQANTYLAFAISGTIGSLLSGWLPQYAHISYRNMFIITGVGKGLLAICLSPFLKDPVIRREDQPEGETKGVRVRRALSDIWATVKLIRVLKPIIFILIFAMMPGNSSVFNTYLVQGNPICTWGGSSCLGNLADDDGNILYGDFCSTFSTADSCNKRWGGLDFTESMYSYIGLLGAFGGMFGSFLFRIWLIRVQWHCMFASIVILVAIISLLQLPLMLRVASGKTWNEAIHIPDLVFALGDDVVMATAGQLMSLPINILMARLCPAGAEGTTFALVTSIQGVGGTIGGVFSKTAITAFGIQNYDWSRLWQLTLMCALLKLGGLPFLPLVPRNITDTDDTRSATWAGVFMGCIFFGGLFWALFNIFAAFV